MSERYNELIKSMLSNQVNRIEHMINSEIAYNLPILSKKEDQEKLKEIDQIRNIGNKKELKRTFYNDIKKNYSNFTELTYLTTDTLYDKYILKNLIYEIKTNCVNESPYYYSLFLEKMFLLTKH